MTRNHLVTTVGRGRQPTHLRETAHMREPTHMRESTQMSEYDPLRDIKLEMNRLFDDVFSGLPMTWPRLDRTALWGTNTPRADVSETDKEVKVSIDLPGMEEKDIRVEVDAGALFIHGERREEKEEKVRDWLCREQSYGTFQRMIPMPTNIEGEQAKATFKKGVLTVTIPKREDEQTQRKTIKIENE